MKPVPTRRTWRQLYRRSRLYLPLVVLLLLAMALYLPLSPPWLTGAVEKAVREKTGLAVDIDRVRVRLCTAQVDVFGIELESAEGGLPFRIEEVRLSGTMAEMLAGDGRWPAEIEVSSPSPLHVDRSPEGALVPSGPLRTIIDTFSNRKPEGRAGGDSASPIAGSTPGIVVRNIVVSGDPNIETVPPLRLDLQQIEIPARAGPGEPLQVMYRGVVTAGGSERVSGEGVWVPGSKRVELRARADGIGHHFQLPQVGGIDVTAEGLAVQASGTLRDDGEYELIVRGDADRFGLEETRLNGERWIDEKLHLRARADLNPQTLRARNVSARLESEQIDVRLSGDAELANDYEADLRLEVAQVPAIAFAVLRRSARGEGFDVDDTTSPTLTLDVSARGPLAKTGELRLDGGIEARRWRVSSPDMPATLDVRHLKGRIENNVLHLPVLDIGFGDIDIAGSIEGRLPIRGANEEPFAFQFGGDAPADEVLRVLRGFDVSTGPVLELGTGMTFSVEGSVPVEQTPEGVRVLATNPDAAWSANVAWTEGTARIENLAEPVSFTAGRVSASAREARATGLRLAWSDVTADLEARFSLDEGTLLADMPAADLHASVQGPVPSMMRLASHAVHLPFPADKFGGQARLDIRSQARLDEIAKGGWEATLELEDAGGAIEIPYSELRISNLSARIDATPARLDVSRFSARVQEDAVVEGRASFAENGLVANVELSSPVRIVEEILPKELNQFVADGTGSATAEVRIFPRGEIPPGADVYSRFAAYLAGREGALLGVRNDAPLQLAIDGRIRPGEVAVFYHRDFPHPITNIRGDITADETGFQFNGTRASFGESDDVEVTGYATLGHVGLARVEFDVTAPDLNINDWLHGWGTRPWAEKPFVRPPRARPPGEVRQLVEIEGKVRLRRTQFLTVPAQNMDADLRFESWRGRHGSLDVTLHEADVYEGRVRGSASVHFPSGEDRLTSFTTQLDATGVQLQPFMTDLRGSPSDFDGRFNGTAKFGGEIGDYSTWTGEGAFRVRESGFIGKQAFRRLTLALNLGNRDDFSPTEITGTASMKENVISFPDMAVESRDIQMLSPGTVNVMTGRIEFDLVVNVLDSALEPIPFLSGINRVLNELKNRIVRFRVHGTVSKPEISTQTLNMDRESFFGAGRRAMQAASERLQRVEEGFGLAKEAPGDTEADP